MWNHYFAQVKRLITCRWRNHCVRHNEDVVTADNKTSQNYVFDDDAHMIYCDNDGCFIIRLIEYWALFLHKILLYFYTIKILKIYKYCNFSLDLIFLILLFLEWWVSYLVLPLWLYHTFTGYTCSCNENLSRKKALGGPHQLELAVHIIALTMSLWIDYDQYSEGWYCAVLCPSVTPDLLPHPHPVVENPSSIM